MSFNSICVGMCYILPLYGINNLWTFTIVKDAFKFNAYFWDATQPSLVDVGSSPLRTN